MSHAKVGHLSSFGEDPVMQSHSAKRAAWSPAVTTSVILFFLCHSLVVLASGASTTLAPPSPTTQPTTAPSSTSLPALIQTSGSFVDFETNPNGTTVDVGLMQMNTPLQNLSAAHFYAMRLRFSSFLAIDAGSFSVRGIETSILIQDASVDMATVGGTLVIISGTFFDKTNITISGGAFTVLVNPLVVTFVQIATVSLCADCAIVVQNAVFTDNGSDGSATIARSFRMLLVNGAFMLKGNSSVVKVVNNSFSVSAVTLSTTNFWLAKFDVAVNVGLEGLFELSSNTIVIEAINCTGPWQFVVMSATSGISLAGGTVSVTNNTIAYVNSTFMGAFMSNFVTVTSSTRLSLKDAGVLLVAGHRVTFPNSSFYSPTTAVLLSGLLTCSGTNSTVRISDNSFAFVSMNLVLATAYISFTGIQSLGYPSATFAITNNGTVIFSYNTVTFGSLSYQSSVSTSPQVTLIGVSAPSPVLISDGGAVLALGNVIGETDIPGSLVMTAVNVGASLSVDDGRLAISSNTISMHNSAPWSLFVLRVSSGLFISGGGSVAVLATKVLAHNITGGTPRTIVVQFYVGLNITLGTLFISGTLVNSSGDALLTSVALLEADRDVFLTNGSSIRLMSNRVYLANVSYVYIAWFAGNCGLFNGSFLFVMGNVVDTPNAADGYLLWFQNQATALTEGTISLSSNRYISSTGKLIWFGLDNANEAALIHTCGNAVQGIPCRWDRHGVYGCPPLPSYQLLQLPTLSIVNVTDCLGFPPPTTSITTSSSPGPSTVSLETLTSSETAPLSPSPSVASTPSRTLWQHSRTGSFSLTGSQSVSVDAPSPTHTSTHFRLSSSASSSLQPTSSPQTTTSPSIAASRTRTGAATQSPAASPSDSHTQSTPAATRTHSMVLSLTDSRHQSHTAPTVSASHASPSNTLTTSRSVFKGMLHTPSPRATITHTHPNTHSDSRLQTHSLAHTQTSVATTSRSPLQTGSRTRTDTTAVTESHTLIWYCQYSCSDVIAAHLLTTNSSSPLPPAEEAAESYWASFNASSARAGCASTLNIPFALTQNGRAARILVHFNLSGRFPLDTVLNVTRPLPVGNALPTSNPGALAATNVLATVFRTGVFVLDVRRTDSTPLSAVSGSVAAIPSTSMYCQRDGTKPLLGLPPVKVVLQAPPPAIPTDEKNAIAVVSGVSPTMQTVAAIGLLRCSPGSKEDVETEAGVRALVPVALSGTCKGAVQGALLTIGIGVLLSVVAVGTVMYARGVSLVIAASVTWCPSILTAVWSFLQMGLIVCGSRLVTDRGGDVGLGVAGVVMGAIVPFAWVFVAWGFVSRRCVRLEEVWQQGLVADLGVLDSTEPHAEMQPPPSRCCSTLPSALRRLRRGFLPSCELDGTAHPSSRAFASLVGRYRLQSSAWVALPVLQPMILLAVVFVEGALCSVVLFMAAMAMLAAGLVLHLGFRPQRVLVSNFVQAVAMTLNACTLFVSGLLVSNPLEGTVLGASRSLAKVQLALTVIQVLHDASVAVYMYFWARGTFVAADTAEFCTEGALVTLYTKWRSKRALNNSSLLINLTDGSNGISTIPAGYPTDADVSSREVDADAVDLTQHEQQEELLTVHFTTTSS